MNGHSIKQFTVFGKPHSEPYRLMEGLLLQQAKLIGLDLPSAGQKLPFGAVYAVGDNPASDIAGARAAGLLPAFLGCFLHAACLCAVQLCMKCCVRILQSVYGPANTSVQSVYGPKNTSAVHAWQLKITCLLLVLPVQMLPLHVSCLTLPLGLLVTHVVR